MPPRVTLRDLDPPSERLRILDGPPLKADSGVETPPMTAPAPIKRPGRSGSSWSSGASPTANSVTARPAASIGW
jgi:hypothetical protein